ncbi:MAG: hypothetical protein FJW88_02515 [Actinobacteria bacterium]|nr:hypothetical protein [Actinomycetota bacterium]
MASPPGTDVIRYERPEPPEIGVTDLVRRVTDLGLGALSVASTVAVDAIERYVPPEPGEGSPTDPGLLRHVPGALVGLGVAAQRQVLRVTAAGERTVGSTVGAVARTPVIGAPIRDVEAYLVRWADRGDIEQARSRARLGDLVRSLAPELATAVLEQLDIATLVDQLPVDAIVAKVDLDALLERVDVDAIVAKVDLDALLERVDVDAIVKRVDVGAIIDRVDLGPMVARVLDEVDIGALIRDSTGSITGDVVDGGRVTAMRVDGVIERVSDRILFRKRPRDLAVGRDDDADGAPS